MSITWKDYTESYRPLDISMTNSESMGTAIAKTYHIKFNYKAVRIWLNKSHVLVAIQAGDTD